MKVPLLDLKPQYQALKTELDEALLRVAASQMFILGPEVAALAQEMAADCGARHGIGVSSGTDALLVALMAMEVGQGDEVVTSPYTFFATGGTIARLGATPVFVDIDPVSYNLDLARLESFLTGSCESRDGLLFNRKSGRRIKAVMPVHLYGQAVDMDALLGMVRRYCVYVVEDAAQAIGSEVDGGRRVGALGDVGCFSFFPTKNLGGFGDGGLCTTNDDRLAARIRQLRVHGMEPKYYHALVGGNFRLDEIQAAVLRVKLRHLDAWHAARQLNADFYDRAFHEAGLDQVVITPARHTDYRHIYNQYVIRVPERDALRRHLGEQGVGTEVYYPVPLHMQECFAYLGYRPEDCPESARAAAETLALPIFPELEKAQRQYVVDVIRDFFRKG
ncbi:MAG: DegT/DnrJ/EryC1/StrS family aminotransferase [Steroidobacteraceae bacterium]